MFTTIKKLASYAEQARWMHTRINAAADGEWAQAGWVKHPSGVKPVFRLHDGTPIVLVNGVHHRSVLVQTFDPTALKATEEECY